MTAARRKGTAAESAVVGWLRGHGEPGALRKPLAGHADEGDIANVADLTIQVKACKDMRLAQWVDETKKQTANGKTRFGVVFHKRRGKGDPGEWYATLPVSDFMLIYQASQR